MEEITKMDKALDKSPKTLNEKDRKIQAAMAKAIREVKRDADTRNIKLAVAGKKSWSVPK